MTERRLHPRTQIQIEVNYRSLDALYENPVLDISQGGMFIRTESPLPLGTEISLEFVIPGQDQTIQSKGLVVWRHESTHSRISSQKPGMGIRFIQMEPQDLKRIKAYVEQILGEKKE